MHASAYDRSRQAVFLGFLALYLAVLAASLGPLSAEARLFPIIILSMAGALVLLKGISTFVPRTTAYLEPELAAAAARGVQPLAPSEPKPGGVGPLTAWAWVAGTLALMYLVGFLAGTGLAILVYSRWICRDSWLAAALTAGITVAFVYVVFVEALHLELGFGFLGGLV